MGQRLNYILNDNSNNRNLFSNWEKLFSQLGKKYSLTSAQKLPNKAVFRTLLFILLLAFGTTGVWGQTPDRSGYYYISNYKTEGHYSNGTAINPGTFYLCPSTNLYAANKPFVTDYMTDKDANSIWDIEYVALRMMSTIIILNIILVANI